MNTLHSTTPLREGGIPPRGEGYRLPAVTQIGYVHLQVSDLERSVRFYGNLVGLKGVIVEGNTAYLSAAEGSPILILLSELRSARPKPARSTGLYHTAIRFPERRELAKAFFRLYRNGVAFQGFSDHLVSEAIYLADPDENGVELYCDRPRTEWVMEQGQLRMATEPLDLESLVRELSEEDKAAEVADPRTDVGHIHLHVSDLGLAEGFFAGLLGFDVTQRSYPGALFLSAGGYHHHVGVNIWAGRGAPPPPSDAVGLLRVGISLPSGQEFDEVERRLTKEGTTPERLDEHLLGERLLRVKSPDGLSVEFFNHATTSLTAQRSRKETL
ncbi:MAG TPA: VOC family protein [Bacteroidota bacterium]|nr:VOC family protein [Bacteroidota bacterium]